MQPTRSGVLSSFRRVRASTGATKGKKKLPRTERNKEEAHKFDLLQKLLNMLFVGRLLVLRDIFAHVSRFSLLCQTVNVLPWELLEARLPLRPERLTRPKGRTPCSSWCSA